MNPNDPNAQHPNGNQPFRDAMQQSDHDLLIKIDTNVEAMRTEIKTLSTNQTSLDGRVRTVETTLAILAPLPGSPSHSELVKNMADLTAQVNALNTLKDKASGSWTTIMIVSGVISTIVGIIVAVISHSGCIMNCAIK